MSFSTELVHLVCNTGGRRPGVGPLDGRERLLGGLRQGQTGEGLSRGRKVTFTMQKTSHSVWRDTWIAGYIDQVSTTTLFTSHILSRFSGIQACQDEFFTDVY